MDDLIIKYLMGETTPGETTQVEQWISADAGNRKRYEQLRATWEISGRNTLPVPDAQQALQRLKRKLEAAGTGVTGKQTGSPTSVPRGIYRSMRSWRAVAVLAVMLGLGAIMYFISMPKANVDPTAYNKLPPAQRVDRSTVKPVAVPIQTDIAGNSTRHDTLPDGSIVILNKNAVISYPSGLNGDTRTVELRGDAFFSVAHNPSRPFIVHVNDITVKVVGTSFNISGDAGRTEVVVKTGIVQVIAGRDSLKLYAGDKMEVLKTGNYVILNKKSAREQQPGKDIKTDTVVQGKKHRNLADPAIIETQKQHARDIISDMIRLKIIADKDHLSWFALDNRQFIVDGKTIADSVHKVFISKYVKPAGMGYYYGPNQVRGGGLCFEKSDLY